MLPNSPESGQVRLRLLIVCLGNICRSPMAEGALRMHLKRAGLDGQVEVDSAGTGDWHIGHPPDPRAIAVAADYGVDLSALRARQLQESDYHTFDWLLCADAENLRMVRKATPTDAKAQVALLMAWAQAEGEASVPDPYTGGDADFNYVWHLVDAAAGRIAQRLQTTFSSSDPLSD